MEPRHFSIEGRRSFLARSGALLAAAALGDVRALAASQDARGSGVRLAGLHRGPGWLPSEALIREIPRLMELAAVPGAALAVVENGRIWHDEFGVADKVSGNRVGDGTLFEAASLGKPVFAYAVLRLRDAGMIDLDRPLSRYLPPDEPADPQVRRITARHVLSHTTGLPNWRLEQGPLKPQGELGKAFAYSGEGFFYLQRVVEKLTGRSFARHMEQDILKPLGMTRSGYGWLPAYEGRMATGYDERGEQLDVYADIGRKLQPLAEKWQRPIPDWRYEDSARAMPLAFPRLPNLPVYMVPNAAGSFLTTPEDYARFVMAACAPPGAGGLALTERSHREMFAPQVRLNSALSWGLGWGLEKDADGDGHLFWHWGANGSFRNFVLGDTHARRGLVILTNSANGPKLYQRIVAEATGRDHPAFMWFQV